MKHWYTNNLEEHVFNEGCVPEGYIRGRLKSTIDKQRQTEMNKPDSIRKLQYLKRAQTNKQAQHKRTEESKAKMHAAKVGFIPWNKGLTKETDARVAKASNKTRQGMLNYAAFLKRHDPEFYNRWRTNARVTMKKNGTSKSSKPEEDYYKLLVNQYGENDVIRHYRDDSRYPYECDFYIKSQDLFIELNLHPSHYTHPYDETCDEDIQFLNYLKQQNTPWSTMIINVWSQRDVAKVQCAIRNNLNYKQIYSNYIASHYSDVMKNK